MFVDFLTRRGGRRPYVESDYFDYIDGKPRYDGVRAFLASREHRRCPRATRPTRPSAETVCGLGNRKNDLFSAVLRDDGVAAVPRLGARCSTISPSAGTKMAVVSSSRNAPAVLAAAGLADRFEVVVDGDVAGRARPGRQAGARHLPRRRRRSSACRAERAVVVEDARLRASQAGRGRRLRAGHRRRPRRRRRPAARRRRRRRGRRPGRAGDRRERASQRRRADRAPTTRSTAMPVPGRRRGRCIETRVQRPTDLGVTETLFAVGNGYLGMRGNVEEGRETPRPRHLHQRLPRDLADPARRGGVRLRPGRPDDRQRPRRQADQALRRRRAAAALGRRPRALRPHARLPRRACCAATSSGARRPASGCRSSSHPDGLVHPAAPGDHDLRGHDARRRRPGGDLLADS